MMTRPWMLNLVMLALICSKFFLGRVLVCPVVEAGRGNLGKRQKNWRRKKLGLESVLFTISWLESPLPHSLIPV
jgi:hypothetical protein